MTLNSKDIKSVLSDLNKADLKLKKLYPGDSADRQPVQTVYGGAQLFKRTSIKRMGELALKSFSEYAPDVNVFAKAFELDEKNELTGKVYSKVIEKLKKEAVEDFRIDFEDGFGNRPDKEEDETAEFTAKEVAKAMKENLLSPFFGIRIKTFSEELKRRAIRTLDIFLSTLLKETKGKLPDNFVVTLPDYREQPGQMDNRVFVPGPTGNAFLQNQVCLLLSTNPPNASSPRMSLHTRDNPPPPPDS